MIKALLFDFSRTLLFPKDRNYKGGLNLLHRELSKKPDYVFFDHFELNTKLLEYLKTVKEKMGLYIFTTESIQDNPAIDTKINELFLKVYSAKRLNLDKKNPKSYEYILKDLNLKADEILYFDDSIVNVNAALEAGVKAVQYKNNQGVVSYIKSQLL